MSETCLTSHLSRMKTIVIFRETGDETDSFAYIFTSQRRRRRPCQFLLRGAWIVSYQKCSSVSKRNDGIESFSAADHDVDEMGMDDSG